jgi:hypothetical protein
MVRSVLFPTHPIPPHVASALIDLCAVLYAEARLLIASARRSSEDAIADLFKDLHAEVVRETEATIREVTPLIADLDAQARERSLDLEDAWTDHGDILDAACAAEEDVRAAVSRAVLAAEHTHGIDQLLFWLRDMAGLRAVVSMQLELATIG